jgi:abhydrolase domain-containing protein 5
LQVITGAGHHVYADKAETFNHHVIEACKLADSGEVKKQVSIQIKSSSPANELEGETSNTESEENILAVNDSYSPAQRNPCS